MHLTVVLVTSAVFGIQRAFMGNQKSLLSSQGIMGLIQCIICIAARRVDSPIVTNLLSYRRLRLKGQKCWSCHPSVSLSHLVLQACTQDEVIVGHLPTTTHKDVFGLPVDANHLPSHHVNAGMQRDLGQVSAAVCVTEGREEDWVDSETLILLGTFFTMS